MVHISSPAKGENSLKLTSHKVSEHTRFTASFMSALWGLLSLLRTFLKVIRKPEQAKMPAIFNVNLSHFNCELWLNSHVRRLSSRLELWNSSGLSTHPQPPPPKSGFKVIYEQPRYLEDILGFHSIRLGTDLSPQKPNQSKLFFTESKATHRQNYFLKANSDTHIDPSISWNCLSKQH